MVYTLNGHITTTTTSILNSAASVGVLQFHLSDSNEQIRWKGIFRITLRGPAEQLDIDKYVKLGMCIEHVYVCICTFKVFHRWQIVLDIR